jgi:hypothetical protein
MNELILTPEQVAALAGPMRTVVVKSPDGQELGKITPPLTPEQIAELKARAAAAKTEPYFTSAHMRAREEALQAEQERVGKFDRDTLFAFLAKLSQANPEKYGPVAR